jgi:hypothetical protein
MVASLFTTKSSGNFLKVNSMLYRFPKKKLVICADTFSQELLKEVAINMAEFYYLLNLRQHAGITKDVVIVGVGNRAEIWAADRWTNYNQESAEVLAEKLTDLGI